MSVSSPAARPAVLGDALPGALARDAALVAGYAALVGLLAQVVIQLPFTPVPITGQTFGVLLGGMALGWRRALAGMALYALAGLAGVPWFAQAHGGLSALQLPSFGYVVGFFCAAGLTGFLAQRGFDRNPVLTLLAMAAGNAVIYAIGVPWLMVSLHVGLATGLTYGFYPFLFGDVLKAVLGAGLVPAAWLLIGRSK